MSQVAGWLTSFPLLVGLVVAVAAASIVGPFVGVGAGDADVAFRSLAREGWYVALVILLGVRLLAAIPGVRRAGHRARDPRPGRSERIDPFLAAGVRIAVLVLLAAILVSGHGASGAFHATQSDVGAGIDLPAAPLVVRIVEIRSSDPIRTAEIDLLLVEPDGQRHAVTFSDGDRASITVAGVQIVLDSARADFTSVKLAVRWTPTLSSTSYLKDLGVGEGFVLAHSELIAVLEQIVPGASSPDGELPQPPIATLRIEGVDASGTDLDLTPPVEAAAGTGQTIGLASGTLHILDLHVPRVFSFSYHRRPERPLVWAGAILLVLSLLGSLVLRLRPRATTTGSLSGPEREGADR